MGSAESVRPDLDKVDERIFRSPSVAASLSEVGFRSAAELLGMYASQPAYLRTWLRGAQINRDANLRLQYLAGLGLNRSVAATVYGEIERRSPFPDGFFQGSPDRLARL